MHETLERDFTLVEDVTGTAVIAKTQADAACDGNALEVLAAGMTSGDGDDANTAGNLAAVQGFAAQNGLDTSAQGRKLAVEQTRLHAGKQPLGVQQGREFLGIEPQAGQFIAVGAGFGVVVATALAVVFDGGCREYSACLR
ncbi:MAG: hypothetical protein ACOY3V_02085 [Pseudomonadota bacterium]